MEKSSIIWVKDNLKGKHVAEAEQGALLSPKINELYAQVVGCKNQKVEINFSEIEEISLEFVYQMLEDLEITEVIQYFLFTEIETEDVLSLLKLALSNLITLSNL